MSAENAEQPGPLFIWRCPSGYLSGHSSGAHTASWIEPPSQPHSETSREAAESIKPHAQSMRETVAALFSSRGATGLTDEEGYVILEMSPSTYRPRRIELQKAGRIKDSGRTRNTASGRRAVVWVAT